MVGVNRFTDDDAATVTHAPDYTALAAEQRSRLKAARARRDSRRWRDALAALEQAAREPDVAIMPALVEAVRARATVGEISDTLRRVWGTYQPHA